MNADKSKQDDWEEHWDRYADVTSRNPAQRMRHSLVTELLGESRNPSEMRLLDIGSGQGDLAAKLRRELPQARLVGFEMSACGVEMSKKKAPGAEFLVADLFQPPDALKPYEGWATDAVCSEVLEHVDDPVAFLRQARNYLADGARLIVTVPGGPKSAFDRIIGHRQHFTRDSIRPILEKGGFVVKELRMAGFPFFNLYRLTVIARGEKLSQDVREGGMGAKFAEFVMGVFRFLFRFNVSDSPLGWQVVAVAEKSPE